MGAQPCPGDPGAPGWLGKHLKSPCHGTVAAPQTAAPLPLPLDGCSSHNTAMAVAALGGFLYILAEHPPADRELQPSVPALLSDH